MVTPYETKPERRPAERLLRACGVVLHDLLGLTELVDDEVSLSIVDDPLDLFSLVSRGDDEAVFLRVDAVVLGNRQSDDGAAGIPAALAYDFEYAVSRATALLVDPLDLAVGCAIDRLVLRNSLESRVHAAILCLPQPVVECATATGGSEHAKSHRLSGSCSGHRATERFSPRASFEYASEGNAVLG